MSFLQLFNEFEITIKYIFLVYVNEYADEAIKKSSNLQKLLYIFSSFLSFEKSMYIVQEGMYK